MESQPSSLYKRSLNDIHLEPLGYQEDEPATKPFLQRAERLKGWPTAPNVVKTSTSAIICDLLLDIILVALSILFLALGLAVRSHDGSAVEEHRSAINVLQEATTYGPTVFPILFACVVGRAAQAILQWRLEKGVYIGSLDVLAGSTSLTSIVTSLFRLRIISALGLILILVWSLSPIGGQASLRLMTFGDKNSISPADLPYLDVTSSHNLSAYDNADHASLSSVVNSLFVASVIAPAAVKHSTLDAWQNVKMPLIEHYEDISTPDEAGWFNVSQDQSTFASLLGVPITSLPKSGPVDYSVSIETSYFYLDCTVANAQWSNRSAHVPNGSVAYDGPGAAMWSNDNDTLRSATDPADLKPRNFGYWSWGVTAGSVCTLATTYIEAKVVCAAMAPCSVSRMRRSQQDHPTPGFSLMDSMIDTYGSRTRWASFAWEFTNSAEGHSASPTIVQNYLIAPDDPLSVAVYTIMPGDVELPTTRDYSARLGQLMNAYWSCMTGLRALSGGVNPSTVHMQGTNESSLEAYLFANSIAGVGTKTERYPVIVAHHGWIVALCIASLVMVIASFVHPVVRYFLSRAPDQMLNYSSLLARDNPHIAIPSNGTYLSASDRARLMKNVKVRLGDVKNDGDIGQLAIASIDSQNVAAVRKGRLYR